jgi:CBS domain-containing protein
MKIRDMMTANVQVVHPGATLAEAAARMLELDVGSFPVCESDRLVGFITDRDIVIRALARGLDVSGEIVGNFMSAPVRWCFDDEGLERAAQVMTQNRIRRVVVLDRDKRLVGIVSLGDLAVAGKHGVLAARVLESVSEPATKAEFEVSAA